MARRDVQPVSADVLQGLPKADPKAAARLLQEALEGFDRKVISLDDDPTGVQTVHDVSVYTSWGKDAVLQGFSEDSRLFFVLTNSRGLTRQEAKALNRDAAASILLASHKTGKDYIVISRSDSTLRGHYPLETDVLRENLEALTSKRFDGEIILPYFKEGGRLTLNNIHYVRMGDQLIPAGLTEFAGDKTFGYASSNLGDWCEEKTGGRYKAKDCVYISIEELRSLDVEGIAEKLMSVKDFNKVIVNAVEDADVWVFLAAMIRAMGRRKEFILRSAAAVPKALGGIGDRPLLSKDELVDKESSAGGLIIVGSHVQKTTEQLEYLQKSGLPVEFFEFDASKALQKGELMKEAARLTALLDKSIARGKTAAMYTSRTLVDTQGLSKDEKLLVSVEIARAVTAVVEGIQTKPSFIIAKGGITSSQIGVQALKVQKARVLGQILPGVPVWQLGQESRFPGLSYVIFPGNVGDADGLFKAVQSML